MPGPVAYPSSGTIEHPTLGQVRYQITEVSDIPDEQVAATIGLMRQYASEDAQRPEILTDVIHAAQSTDALGDTWEYLRRNGRRGMAFVKDEQTGAPFESANPYTWLPVVETLIRPADQCAMANPQGDCDDFAMYGAAHLIARGVPCAFATVAADPREPDVYSHVYLVAYPAEGPYAGQRVPLDLSHGPYLGWEVPNAQSFKYAEWPIHRRIGILETGLVAFGAYLLYRALKGAN